MYNNNNMMFSTSDKDNDQRDTTCMSGGAWQGGWWLNGGREKVCSLSNLNGKYIKEDQNRVNYRGIVWKEKWSDSWYSFKSSKMTICPVDALCDNLSCNENNNNDD